MYKFLITRKSQNPHTGPILVTTSPRLTCPTTCPFKNKQCYAEKGYLGGFVWTKLDQTPINKTFGNNVRVYSFPQLLAIITFLPNGTLWRHNQAGDIPSYRGIIDKHYLELLTIANLGKRGFTFTHNDPILYPENIPILLKANRNGFTINLSGNNLNHADRLFDTQCGPVTVVLRSDTRTNLYTPKKRKVVICPAFTRPGTQCADCKLCTRQRDFIIGFPLQV